MGCRNEARGGLRCNGPLFVVDPSARVEDPSPRLLDFAHRADAGADRYGLLVTDRHFRSHGPLGDPNARVRHDLIKDRGKKAAVGHLLPAGEVARDREGCFSGSFLGIYNGEVESLSIVSAAAEALPIPFDRRVHGA